MWGILRASLSKSPLSPPSSRCELRTARLKRRISPKFQRGLLEPPEPRRLALRLISVSERLSSLTERTSTKSVRLRENQRFQSLPFTAPVHFLRPCSRLASSPREREVGVMRRNATQSEREKRHASRRSPAKAGHRRSPRQQRMCQDLLLGALADIDQHV